MDKIKYSYEYIIENLLLDLIDCQNNCGKDLNVFETLN